MHSYEVEVYIKGYTLKQNQAIKKRPFTVKKAQIN
jgi:hypothetical protein